MLNTGESSLASRPSGKAVDIPLRKRRIFFCGRASRSLMPGERPLGEEVGSRVRAEARKVGSKELGLPPP